MGIMYVGGGWVWWAVDGSGRQPGPRVCSKIIGCYTGVYEQSEEL